jgi:hypothetical protein
LEGFFLICKGCGVGSISFALKHGPLPVSSSSLGRTWVLLHRGRHVCQLFSCFYQVLQPDP